MYIQYLICIPRVLDLHHPYLIPTSSLHHPYIIPTSSLFYPYFILTWFLHHPSFIPTSSLLHPYIIPPSSLPDLDMLNAHKAENSLSHCLQGYLHARTVFTWGILWDAAIWMEEKKSSKHEVFLVWRIEERSEENPERDLSVHQLQSF